MAGTKTLKVIISGDSKGAKKAFAETGKAAGGMGSSVGKAGKVIGAGLLGAAAGAAAFGVKASKTFTDVGGQTIKMSRLTGLSSEAASRLRTAFQLTGVDAAKAGQSLGIFSKNLDAGKLDGFNHSLAGQKATAKKVQASMETLGKAQKHLSDLQGAAKPNLGAIAKATQKVSDEQLHLKNLQSTGANAMSQFGFKTRDAKGHLLPMHDTLLQVSDVFKKMKNGPEKTALAMQLFGKSGKDMLPFLDKGAEGIKELEAQSDKYGTTLSGKDTDAVKASIKQHRLFTLGMQGLQIQIGRYVLPVITKLTGFMAENMPKAIAVVRSVIAKIGPAVKSFTKPILDFFAGNPRAKFVALSIALGLIAIAVIAAASPVTLIIGGLALLAAGAAYAYKHFTVFRTVIDAVVKAGKAVYQFFATSRPALIALGVAVGLVVAPFALVAAGVVLAYKRFSVFRDVVDSVARFFTGVVGPAIQTFAAGVAQQFQHLVAWTQQYWGQISEAVGHVMAAIGIVIHAGVAVIQALWRTFGSNIIATFKAAWDFVVSIAKVAWALIAGVIKGGIDVVAGIIKFVLAVINGDWGKAWDAIKQIVQGVWETIKAYVTAGINGVLAIIRFVGGALGQYWAAIWTVITGTIAGVWSVISGAVSTGINSVLGVIRYVGGAISGAWDNIWSGLSGVVAGVWDTVSGYVVGGVNTVLGLINDAIRAINAIGGWIGIHIDEIPLIGAAAPIAPDTGIHQFHHADGGIHEAHSAMISSGATRVWAEPETGGEAYIPLAASKRARSMDILGQVASKFGKQVVSAGSGGVMTPGSGRRGTPPSQGGGDTHIHVTVQGSVLSDRDLVDVIAKARRRGLIMSR